MVLHLVFTLILIRRGNRSIQLSLTFLHFYCFYRTLLISTKKISNGVNCPLELVNPVVVAAKAKLRDISCHRLF